VVFVDSRREFEPLKLLPDYIDLKHFLFDEYKLLLVISPYFLIQFDVFLKLSFQKVGKISSEIYVL